MEERNKMIVDVLQTTNNLNNSYCDLYGEYFGQKIGQKIDYNRTLSKVESIDVLLQKEILDSSNMRINSDPEAEEVMRILFEYQSLLNTRIGIFKLVVKKMYGKSEGIGEKYSIFAYSADTKKLKNLENQNNQLGNSLQRIAVPFMQKYR